jgi:ABC-type transporter MlaC component
LDIELMTERKKTRGFQVACSGARQFSSLACLLLASGATAAAQTEPRADQFMAFVNRSLTELATRSGYDAAVVCRRMTAQLVDIDAVATNALGDVSTRMSPRQRADYRAAAVRWAIRDCVRMNADNSGRPLTFAGLRRAQSGGLLLATRSDQPPHMLVWSLRGADRLRAVDLVIDGRSMTLALREEMTSLLNRNDNNIDAAIAALGR